MSDQLENRPMGVPGMHCCDTYAAALPGIIILVHGVNSDGEWFGDTEQGLIDGLNQRLGFDRAQHPDKCMLSKVDYAPEILPGGKINRQLNGKNFITAPCGRSPVIRFRWGYKIAGQDSTDPNAIDEDKEYKQTGRLWLNDMDAWGGGPFQNGTTALPYMWGVGMDDRVFWWWYTNMFPVDGREIYACPPRAYYAHAAHRLKELIKAIRAKQADCPITVVCHSQGNMVTLGAAMLGMKEDAIADTYVMCNPPYNLAAPGMEKFTSAKLPGGTGEFGHVSEAARRETFKRFLAGVAKRAGKGQTRDQINNRMAFKNCETGETVFELAAFPEGDAARTPPKPGIDRDNRGKVFLYCNPHDQVIGITPVQGIGWKGLCREDFAAVEGDGKLYQRVWAQPGGTQSPPFTVGSAAWPSYRYIHDHYNPERFWDPEPPMMRYVLNVNPSQGFISRIVTVVTSVFIWPVTRLFNIPINSDPDKTWEVPINAPVLPEPVTPKSKRYGQVSTRFDERKDPVINTLNPANRDKWQDILPKEGEPLGNEISEAQWEYETNARLRAAKRRGEINDNEEDRRAAMSRYLAENPNATDHGTILTNPEHARKVLAYDVAVGCVNPDMITYEDMQQFRQFAHWMYLKEATELDTEKFTDYWQSGLFKKHQVQYTYNHAHMAANTDIVDERTQSLFGLLR